MTDRLRVMLVDDEPAVLAALGRTLRQQPYELVCATSAGEALDILRRQPVHIIVSDQDMPGMRGTAFLAAVHRAYPETTRFMLTGRASLQVAMEAINQGAITRFFEKPCDPHELTAALAEAAEEQTRRKAMQQEMLRLQNAARTGMVAGGVAHDINNLLTVIGARSSLLPRAGTTDLGREAEAIQGVVRRGASLTRQLMGLLRPRDAPSGILDLNTILTDFHDFLAIVLGDSIELSLILAPNLGPVPGDIEEIHQVISNLAMNARDAMPEGGRLTLRTADCDVAPSVEGGGEGPPPGSYALLFVSDTGMGIAPDVRARLFEPFFTTKGEGKGTGLGLATVARIVREHRGHITVESELGRGSTFTVYLPRGQ